MKNPIIKSIAASHAAQPEIVTGKVLELIALAATSQANFTEDTSRATYRPAVPIDASWTEGAVICLCCGKSFKMLKRHLGAAHGLTEISYRLRFNLSPEHPLTAPNYSEAKSSYAKSAGLGKYARGAPTALAKKE